jgi:NAD-dependent DNA ligase
MSLENTYNAEDLTDREERIQKFLNTTQGKPVYTVEPKFDGLSVEIIYEK